MKAIIMAGGEGSRLRPLTCDCPKPMVPLMGKPVMSYALELLRRHGIYDVAATLQYLPDQVKDYFSDGAQMDLSMRYYVEKQPLGTAGSVKQAEDFLDETFVVLSGDGVTDCDLTAAIEQHRAKGAFATIVVKRVENPLEYGVVVADGEGRIQRFAEKPNWGEVLSDAVNTGIYILEPEVLKYIPADRAYDFGRELFPMLLEKNLPMYAYEMQGYWCDIGDISAYLRAHMDAMDGRIDLNMNVRSNGVYRAAGARIDRGAVLEGPCFIGEDAVICQGARIGAYSVIGAGCVVGENAGIKRAVLWEKVHVGAGAQLRGGILLSDARMGEESCAFEESVIGGGASIGARSSILPGVKIWPRKHIGDSMRIDANVVWGSGEREHFERGCLKLNTPSQASRTAQAYASVVRPKTLLIGRSASSVALSYALAVESGLMAQGVQMLNTGVSTLPQLRVMVHLLHAGGAVFVDEESMRPLDENGAELKASVQRKIENLLQRQDYERAFAAVTKLPISAGRSDLMYIGYLLEHADLETLRRSRPPVAVCTPNEQLLSTAECALEKAGCPTRAEWEDELMELAPGEIGIWLTENGEGMRIAGEDGSLSESEGMLLRVWTMLEQGVRRIVLPMSAPHTCEALAQRYDAQIVRVKGERAHLMNALLEESRHQLMMLFDGLYAAMQCIAMLEKCALTLNDWRMQMPQLSRRVKSIPVEWKDKGRILSSLISEEQDADMTDGVCISRDGTWAWVYPCEDRAECRIVSEAQDMEAAQELCDFYAGKIETVKNSR